MRAQFTGRTDFRGARFTLHPFFKSAQFTGAANFADVQFAAGADFEGALFIHVANFADAQFTLVTDFADAQFTGDVNFEGTLFTHVTGFAGTQFTGRVNFENARFTDPHDVSVYKDSEFTDEPNFAPTRVHSATELLPTLPPGWTTRPAKPDTGEDPAFLYLARVEDGNPPDT